VAEHPCGIGIEFDDGVAPVCLAVIRAISGSHEYIAGRRIDHGPGAAPNRRSTSLARLGLDQTRPVTAQRIPHVQQLAALRVENGDVPLIRWPVADVAARNRN